MVKVDISVDQALLILLDKNRDNQEQYLRLKKIYLSGVTDQNSLSYLKECLSSNDLLMYRVCDTFERANGAATRRYFESHLALETLKRCEDSHDLQNYADELYDDAPSSINCELKEGTQYGDVLALIRNKMKLQFVPNDAKNVSYAMIALSISAVEICRTNPKISLDIYDSKILSEKEKSTVCKIGDQQLVRLLHGGNLLSRSPLPMDDEMFLTSDASDLDFTRGTLSSSGKEGSSWVNKLADSKIHPFVNSISGTMLAQIRLAIEKLKCSTFPFNEERGFKDYFRVFISTLVYFLGGHSLFEFVDVFQIPDIEKALRGHIEYDFLTLESLFLVDNAQAFNCALEKSIKYNRKLIQRKEVHSSLFEKITRLAPASEGEFSWGAGVSPELSECLNKVEKKLYVGLAIMNRLYPVAPQEFEKAKQEVRKLIRDADYGNIEPKNTQKSIEDIESHVLTTSVTNNSIVSSFLGVEPKSVVKKSTFGLC